MKPIFLSRLETSTNDLISETIVIFNHNGVIDGPHLHSALEAELDSNLTADQIVFIIPDHAERQLKETLSNDVGLASLIARFNKRTALLLQTFSHQGKFSNPQNIGEIEQIVTYEKDVLCRRLLTGIFLRNGGFVEANDNYHFVNPSGRHTQKFIRIANLLDDSAEVGFFAFACMSFVSPGIDQVYVDTPSLFSVVAALNEIRLGFQLPSLAIRNFASYKVLNPGMLQPDTKSLCLISASSSGGLATRLIDKFDLGNENVLQLLYLGDTSARHPTVCDLSYDKEANPEGISNKSRVFDETDCEYCKSGSFTVHLHGSQFDIKPPQPSPYIILKSDAPNGLAKTMSRFAKSEALSVTLGQRSGARERDYFIDAQLALNEIATSADLDYILRRVVPFSVSHIIQIDEHSQALAERIAGKFGSEPPPIILPSEIREKIDEKTEFAIIVAAAVIESGRCLTDASRDLRLFAADAPIVYVVGVEKTTDLTSRKSLEKTLIQTHKAIKHQFASTIKITLPKSSETNAWNAELAFWQQTSRNDCFQDCETFIRERIERIGSGTPFRTDLFLPRANGDALKLQPGFVFWPENLPEKEHSQADVFFTISSVLQNLRARSESNENKPGIYSHWFHHTVLSPENFVRFNDDIIQASLLRAALRPELNYLETPIESREFGRIILRLIKSHEHERGGACFEFLLALASNRLQLTKKDRIVVGKEASECRNQIIKAFGDFLQTN